MILAGSAWAAVTAIVLVAPPTSRRTLALFSPAYPIAYLILSGR